MDFVFERREIKYLLDETQYIALLQKLAEREIMPDHYGKTTICNLYFDTPDFLLIRRSIEKPIYKEKLRVRSYGQLTKNGNVFVEIKKKYRSVVYKRRVVVDCATMDSFMSSEPLSGGQTEKEINYFMQFYANLVARMYIAYGVAYFDEPDGLRLTIDDNIVWRDFDLSLYSRPYGKQMLSDKQHLLELKVNGALPLWLSEFLSQNKIFPTSFSKYGKAYMELVKRQYAYDYLVKRGSATTDNELIDEQKIAI